METVDEEFLDASLEFHRQAQYKDDKPFFCWWNSTRMHVFTHLKKESQGKTGLGVYPDGMVEHDGHVGQLLDKLDELGIADNTIVMYSTDNGAEVMSWPDGGTTPFRGEKDTNCEGGWRVPCAIRWPGVIKPGTVSNEMFSHTDMLPTLAAAAGEPDIVEKLKKGYKSGNKTFKVHIDGYNLLPFLKGEVKENPRKGFLYWSDDGDLMALRVEQLEGRRFMEQRAHGFDVWKEPLGATACAEDLQPAQRSVRAGYRRRHVVLRQMDGRSHVPARAGPGDRRRVPEDVRGVPAAPEAGELQHRPGAGEGPAAGSDDDQGSRRYAVAPSSSSKSADQGRRVISTAFLDRRIVVLEGCKVMLRMMIVIGCGALLLVTCVPVAGQPAETNAPAVAVAQASPDPGWEISVAPYFFLASLNGTVGVIGQRAEVSATFRDLFRNLDFAAMGQIEARKGNWSILGDVMYVSLSGKRVTPSPFFGDIDVEVKETILEPAIAYRALKSERGSIDLLGGVRIWHVNTHITFQPRILPLVDVEDSKNWADPIVGAAGVANLSPRVFVLGRFDAGGFGVGSDFTGRVFGGAGFKVKPRVALIGGYRYLRVDYVNEGFIFKTTMSGIVLGAKFKL